MTMRKRLGEAKSHGGFEIWMRVSFKRSLGTKFVANSEAD
jgi:hypothetical protein